MEGILKRQLKGSLGKVKCSRAKFLQTYLAKWNKTCLSGGWNFSKHLDTRIFLKTSIISYLNKISKSASEILDFAASKVNFIFLLNESYKLPAKSLQMNNFMKKTSKNFHKETCSRKSNGERALWNEAQAGRMKVGYHFWKINLLGSNISLISLSLFTQR